MHGCSNIESLPVNALTSLIHLSITECEKLIITSEDFVALTRLASLAMCDCPALISIFMTNGGQLLPASLENLQVECASLPPSCLSSSEDILQSLRGKQPMRLLLLKDIVIQGSNPMLLYAWFQLLRDNKSVKLMSIQGFENTESLNEEMEDILVSFESLKYLTLSSLPQLRTLPKRLCELSALDRLYITNCPELAKRFSEERHKVSHVASVFVDDRWAARSWFEYFRSWTSTFDSLLNHVGTKLKAVTTLS